MRQFLSLFFLTLLVSGNLRSMDEQEKRKPSGELVNPLKRPNHGSSAGIKVYPNFEPDQEEEFDKELRKYLKVVGLEQRVNVYVTGSSGTVLQLKLVDFDNTPLEVCKSKKHLKNPKVYLSKIVKAKFTDCPSQAADGYVTAYCKGFNPRATGREHSKESCKTKNAHKVRIEAVCLDKNQKEIFVYSDPYLLKGNRRWKGNHRLSKKRFGNPYSSEIIFFPDNHPPSNGNIAERPVAPLTMPNQNPRNFYFVNIVQPDKPERPFSEVSIFPEHYFSPQEMGFFEGKEENLPEELPDLNCEIVDDTNDILPSASQKKNDIKSLLN